MLTPIDPTTGRELPPWPGHTNQEADQALALASEASRTLAVWSAEERAAAVGRLGRAIRERVEPWAEAMVQEVGKPIGQARAEVLKCVWACEYYAEQGSSMVADLPVTSDGASWVRHEPLGVVLAIMPWNYPMWQLVRFAAPALIAGNSFLIKHAPNVPRCAELLQQVFSEIELPPGVGTSLRLSNEQVARLIRQRQLAAVTLTGSTRAGREVAAVAGAHLKKCVLELGGSDPFVVLADADVEKAAGVAATARLQNNGQSCIAAKRFVVEAAVAEPFIASLRRHMEAAVMGDPAKSATTLGPLAREDLRECLHRQVVASVELGAKLVLGGKVPEGAGWFYPATLVVDCAAGMPLWDEETFGPVAAVQVVADADAAWKAAHHPDYGLGASLWTSPERARELVGRLDAGAVFVNGMTKSDPRLPFGGVRDSGYGRELGPWGVHEFVNRKTVWIAP